MSSGPTMQIRCAQSNGGVRNCGRLLATVSLKAGSLSVERQFLDDIERAMHVLRGRDFLVEQAFVDARPKPSANDCAEIERRVGSPPSDEEVDYLWNFVMNVPSQSELTDLNGRLAVSSVERGDYPPFLIRSDCGRGKRADAMRAHLSEKHISLGDGPVVLLRRCAGPLSDGDVSRVALLDSKKIAAAWRRGNKRVDDSDVHHSGDGVQFVKLFS